MLMNENYMKIMLICYRILQNTVAYQLNYHIILQMQHMLVSCSLMLQIDNRAH